MTTDATNKILTLDSPLRASESCSPVARTTKDSQPEPGRATSQEELPGWFWRTSEGKALLVASKDDPALDFDMGWQGEED